MQCGHCHRNRPQKAKVVKNDLEEIKNLLANKSIRVVVSCRTFLSGPPSVATQPLVLAGLLKKLGFSHVGLTAVGAELNLH